MDNFLLLKALFFLASVIALIYLCFFVAKKRLQGKTPTSCRMHIIEHKYVNPKLCVTLLEIDGERMVLAAGTQGVSLQKLEKQSS